ncbi:MAG: DUF6125 family protein [Desulfobacterales bacterium]
MASSSLTLENAPSELLVALLMDALHRIVVHYGQWMAQVDYQLGSENALAIEEDVWNASVANQMGRLGKTMGFAVEDGIPSVLRSLPREKLLELLRAVGVNWLANDGIWFQTVEKRFGMVDAKRCNDTCWGRFSPFEAVRIKALLNLPDRGGLSALKQAIAFRMYAVINVQSFEDVDDRCMIFRMNDCRVQAARKRKGLADYPCKSAGLVEYPYFAKTIDPRIHTECIGCPPDPHPDDWYCAWKFTVNE